ncbi:MAG: dihydrolipoyl dehydrogenase [Xanthomonadales bacterium]|jgi:dihydrolipoamide dehydrogenase|nr:dihydrolipoyl dehydrogenase [Xanthomonadales bacterium]
MNDRIEARVPDLGGMADVPVIELLVKSGDTVRADQGLLTLESDKATMEVPAPVAGVIESLAVKVGDKLSSGMVVAVLKVAATATPPAPLVTAAPAAPAPAAAPSPAPTPAIVVADADTFDIVVLGAGPGGYTAAFRAADLGAKVALVERYPALGGVCLNVGCIPSKALLHAARVMDEVRHFADLGIRFGEPDVDLPKLRGMKDKVVGQLTRGLAGMAKQRGVTVVQGNARFAGPHALAVDTPAGPRTLGFRHAIIAAGSQPVKLPGLPWGDPRLMDSTDALALSDIPGRLLVIGGGIIGLEMACVYEALGARVSVVELSAQLMPGADPDLIKPLATRIGKRYEAILLNTKVSRIEAGPDGLTAHFEGAKAPAPQLYDRVLCAVGRTPNGKKIAAEAAGVIVDARGYIAVDKQMRTNIPHIFAIGDIVGNPMLAHKATHEGKVAAEVACGHKSEFVARVIPSVAYTDPEIAWVGLTELDAAKQGIAIGKGVFPYAASGRAIGIHRTEGFSKLIFDEHSHRLLGAGIVGPNAGDLISEAALAIEMGCDAADIALTIHPHPTLSESVGMAAEVYEGTITDLYLPKKR